MDRHSPSVLVVFVSLTSIAAAGCIARQAPPASANPAAPAAVASPTPAAAAPETPGPSLRAAAEAAHRRVGTALMSARLADARARALAASQFDSLTPENEMKWYAVEPRPGGFSFAAGDQLVAFAAAS